MVLGGARPPPQSRKAQTSPVSGTYQMRLAPPYATVSDEMQPDRSVLAAAWPAKRKVAKMAAGALRVLMSMVLDVRC